MERCDVQALDPGAPTPAASPETLPPGVTITGLRLRAVPAHPSLLSTPGLEAAVRAARTDPAEIRANFWCPDESLATVPSTVTPKVGRAVGRSGAAMSPTVRADGVGGGEEEAHRIPLPE